MQQMLRTGGCSVGVDGCACAEGRGFIVDDAIGAMAGEVAVGGYLVVRGSRLVVGGWLVGSWWSVLGSWLVGGLVVDWLRCEWK